MLRRILLLWAFACALPAAAQPTNEPTDVAATEAGDDAAPATPSPFSISGGATVTSQYRFRGISLSDEQPAVQGTVNLNHDSGAYAGVWVSSTGGAQRGGSNAEVDLYAGYSAPLSSGVTLDAGLLYYAFPASKGGDFDFFEPYAGLSGTLGPATAKVGLSYAWEQDALRGNSNVYVFGDLSAGIPSTAFTVKTHLGYSKGDTPLSPSGDYLDWMIGADYVVRGLTFGLSYVDTDLSAAQAARGGVRKDIVDQAVVASVRVGF